MLNLKEESSSIGKTNWARVCNTCQSAGCTVYCRTDSAYLCAACDARIHAANRHERVWVCEACERAPAAFVCKADAASLCTACDADIHAANPLARRHHRIPILPLPGSLYGNAEPQATATADPDDGFLATEADRTIDEENDDNDDEAASWLLVNPGKSNNNNNNNNSQNNINGFLFSGEVVDEYLDLAEYHTCQENQLADHYNVAQKSYGGDSVVPVQCGEGKGLVLQQQLQQQQQQQTHNYQLEMMEFETSKSGYGYPASISHSVSVSSMDVGVVPESTMSDVSISHPRPPKGTIDLFSSPPLHMPPQLTPMDREARVLRYREKKKMRKFEKTIRYASRKAYAETRPRIKGRFAKRTDAEVEVDQMFSTSLMAAEGGYGIVPSF